MLPIAPKESFFIFDPFATSGATPTAREEARRAKLYRHPRCGWAVRLRDQEKCVDAAIGTRCGCWGLLKPSKWDLARNPDCEQEPCEFCRHHNTAVWHEHFKAVAGNSQCFVALIDSSRWNAVRQRIVGEAKRQAKKAALDRGMSADEAKAYAKAHVKDNPVSYLHADQAHKKMHVVSLGIRFNEGEEMSAKEAGEKVLEALKAVPISKKRKPVSAGGKLKLPKKESEFSFTKVTGPTIDYNKLLTLYRRAGLPVKDFAHPSLTSTRMFVAETTAEEHQRLNKWLFYEWQTRQPIPNDFMQKDPPAIRQPAPAMVESGISCSREERGGGEQDIPFTPEGIYRETG